VEELDLELLGCSLGSRVGCTFSGQKRPWDLPRRLAGRFGFRQPKSLPLKIDNN